MAKIGNREKMFYLQKVVENIQNEINSDPETFETVYHGSEAAVMMEVRNRINDLLEMHMEAYGKKSLREKMLYRFFPGN